MNQDQALELIDRYICEELSEEEADKLRAWLLASRENMRLFADCSHLNLSLRSITAMGDSSERLQQMLINSDSYAGLVVEDYPEDNLEMVEPSELPGFDFNADPEPTTQTEVIEEDQTPTLVASLGGLRVYRKTADEKPRRRNPMRWAVAAVFTLLFVFGWLMFQPRDIATLTMEERAKWDSSLKQPTLGGPLEKGVYRLARGYAELRFNNDTTVLLDAPVEFEIIDAESMDVSFGKLTAKVSTITDRFIVSTPSSYVIDLGTEFGVEVDNTGQTRTAVFDGTVVMSDSAELDDAATSLNLYPYQQTTVPRDGTIPVAADKLEPAHNFVCSLDDAYGKLAVYGDVVWHQTQPPLVSEAYDSNDQIHVFRERTRVETDKLFNAPVLKSGVVYSDTLPVQPHRLPTDHPVDSYLVHITLPDDNSTIRGNIFFPRPIVAVLYHSDDLAETDRVFGHPRTRYAFEESDAASRGLVPTDAFPDALAISEDRRWLELRFAGAEHVEQLRVLIESR